MDIPMTKSFYFTDGKKPERAEKIKIKMRPNNC